MILFLALVLFLAVDMALFVQFYQPHLHRLRWWAFLPGSGFASWWIR